MTPLRCSLAVAIFCTTIFSQAQNFQWRDVVQDVTIRKDGAVIVNDERTLWTDGDFGEAFLCVPTRKGVTVKLIDGGALSPGPEATAFQQPCEGGQELVVKQNKRVSERRIFFDYQLNGTIDLYSDTAVWIWDMVESTHPSINGYRLSLTTPTAFYQPYRIFLEDMDKQEKHNVLISENGRKTTVTSRQIQENSEYTVALFMNPDQFSEKGTEPALNRFLQRIKITATAIPTTPTANTLTVNVNEIIDSSLPLEGALQTFSDSVVGQYIPGYGFQINSYYIGPAWRDETVLPTIIGIVTGLSSTVRGLPSDEWVSVGMTRTGFATDARRLYVVRVKPGQPETVETYVNGERQ